MKNLISMLNSMEPLKELFHIKIENPPYMELVIEGIGKGPRNLPAISVAHYGEQNGDLMRDPEMCFEIHRQDGRISELRPYYFRNDYMGIEEESVIAGDRDTYRTDLTTLRKHGSFARTWDVNIGDQGFPAALLKSLETAGK